VLHPLRDGVIADLDAAVGRCSRASSAGPGCAGGCCGPPRSSACPAAPPGWNGGPWPPALSVIPRCTVRLIDEPVAAAAGAGFDLAQGAGVFIVDVGGGTTESAVVAGGQIVRARSLRMGGNAMDDAIVTAVKAELA